VKCQKRTYIFINIKVFRQLTLQRCALFDLETDHIIIRKDWAIIRYRSISIWFLCNRWGLFAEDIFWKK